MIHGKEGGICEGEVTRTGNCVEVPVGDTSLLCGEACHGKKEESVDRVQKMGYNGRKGAVFAHDIMLSVETQFLRVYGGEDLCPKGAGG